jgi:hypothetical protein
MASESDKDQRTPTSDSCKNHMYNTQKGKREEKEESFGCFT